MGRQGSTMLFLIATFALAPSVRAAGYGLGFQARASVAVALRLGH